MPSDWDQQPIIKHGARHVSAWCKACQRMVQGMSAHGAGYVEALEHGLSLLDKGQRLAVMGTSGVMRVNDYGTADCSSKGKHFQ